jgi:hypothetical protein
MISTTGEGKLNIIKNIKTGIWLYFLLLIFEGALRKWVFPGLSSLILIIRDPLVLYLFYKAQRSGLLKNSVYLTSILIVSTISFILTIYVGHGNILVALYGLRIILIQFPFVFLIGNIFSKQDSISLGKFLMYVNIGMTILVAIQYFSPQTAWINKGIGDAESSGFSGADGYFRVPGTFSFTNGLSFFYGFVSSYIFYFWIENNSLNKIVLYVSTFCLLIAIPLSISRTVLIEFITTCIFLLLISGRNPKIIGRIFFTLLVLFVLFTILSNLTFFANMKNVFLDRLNNANDAEGGAKGIFIDRLLGGMISAISNNSLPFWGLGLGMGTNAGATLLTGTSTYLISEGEWGRLIGEMGLLPGVFFICIKLALVISLFYKSWGNIGKGNVLPWLILSFAFMMILMGQWGQPTALGFCVLSGGLVISSLKETF